MTKERITVTIDTDLLQWLDQNIEQRIFANRSHGVVYSVQRLQEGKE